MLPIGAILSGGSDDGGSGNNTSSNTSSPPPPPPPSPTVVYMWTSTTTTNGDINFNGMSGVAGADEICDNDAGSSFATTVSTHRALIASSTFDPRNIFSNDPPIQRPTGTVIISLYSNFFDSTQTLSTWIVGGAAQTYWTGIQSNGSPATQNCSNWQNDAIAGRGTSGTTGFRGVSRYRLSENQCSLTARQILCISY